MIRSRNWLPPAVTTRPRLVPLEDRCTPAAVGALDPSFGTAGKFAGFPTAGTIGGVAVDPFGRTVLAGSIPGAGGNDILVVRLNPDGTPDTSFGSGGRMTVDIAGGDDAGRGVATDAAGNVVVAGTSGAVGEQMAFVRLRAADGSLDPTFGGAGTGITLVAPSAGFNNIAANDVKLLPDGTIVATGNSLSAGLKNSLVVAELTPDGSALAPGFNGGAVKLIAFQFGVGSDTLGEAVTTSGSDIVVGGVTNNGAPGATSQFAAVRLLANGDFDPAFALDSVVSLPIAPGFSSRAFGVATDAAGDIFLAGLASVGMGQPTLEVAKLLPSGDLDTSFGGGAAGMVPGFFGSQIGGMFTEGDGIAVRPDGRVVVGGTTQTSVTAFNFFALQLTQAGQLDPSFNAGGPTPGINSFDFGTNAANFVGAVAVAPTGRIVIAGTDDTVGGVRVARLIGTVERPRDFLAAGTADGTATLIGPAAPATGTYPTPGTVVNLIPGFTGETRVALGDVNGDGVTDFIAGAGPGGASRVRVIDGRDGTTVLADFLAFDPSFTGGVYVAAGDLTGDGLADVVVTPDAPDGQGIGPVVRVFGGASLRGGTNTPLKVADFLGIADLAGNADTSFRGGARAAVADVNGDGRPDLLITAGSTGGPRVTVWNGTGFATAAGGKPTTNPIANLFVFESTQRGGAFVSGGDITGDGNADLVFSGGPDGGPRVRVVDGAKLLALPAAQLESVNLDDPANLSSGLVASNFFAGDPTSRGGVRITAVDLDGSGKAALVTGSGTGVPSSARVYKAATLLTGTSLASGERLADQTIDPFGTTPAGGVYVG